MIQNIEIRKDEARKKIILVPVDVGGFNPSDLFDMTFKLISGGYWFDMKDTFTCNMYRLWW